MKIICVPKDKAAEKKLDFNDATLDELIEMRLSDKDFYTLFESGFFNAINRIAGSNIDDFEDDNITDKLRLTAVLDGNIFDALKSNNESKEIVDRIKTLFREALERETGVYFFL